MPLGHAPPRLHPLDRSPRVERINGYLDKAWSRGWSNYPSLDGDVLREKAGYNPALTARDASDNADFDERLDALCKALVDEAQLNSLGRTIAHGQLVRVIKQRQGLGELWAKRPELLVTRLASPIIVLGQMRSGTTRIHRLLAADPAHSSTRFCDSWSPISPASKFMPDLRPIGSAAALAMARSVNPWLDTVHPFGAARADEELGWLAGALDHATYEAQWRIPSYSQWSEARDPFAITSEFARILRTDAAYHGNAQSPRVMKCPQFSEMLPALLEAFPDAKLVIAKRDNEEVLKSCISLVANQMAVQSDSADLGFIESEWRRKLSLREERLQSAISDFKGPISHLAYSGLNENWEHEITQAYADLELNLTPAALKAMRAEMKKAEAGSHHSHTAQLKQFSGD
ncbi:MAG: sulfotransferase [Marinomonas sp.]